MEKIKLTQAQIDAINKALSHYGDADYLVEMHQNVINKGHEWSQWNALNELSVTALSHALKYGFEVEEQPEWQHISTSFNENYDKLLAIFESIGKTTTEELLVEQDYELASLSYAMQQKDQSEIERSKKRLAEIHKELEGLG
ncbi:hypothetical protein ACTHOQ_14175 [Solibacillus silvestris]|uniref:hypothetical protein n=1 Tax=Solibacillus silvestris TaxID=76853 RepID=UPI003F8063E1